MIKVLAYSHLVHRSEVMVLAEVIFTAQSRGIHLRTAVTAPRRGVPVTKRVS